MRMRILAIGSHPDDVEHAMGGTISKLSDHHEFRYICFSKCLDIPRNKNIMKEYNDVVKKLKNVKCEIHDLPNRRLPEHTFEIREILEKVKSTYEPEFVFTHSSYDIHQDHHAI